MNRFARYFFSLFVVSYYIEIMEVEKFGMTSENEEKNLCFYSVLVSLWFQLQVKSLRYEFVNSRNAPQIRGFDGSKLF